MSAPTPQEFIKVVDATSMKGVTKIMLFQRMASLLSSTDVKNGWLCLSEINGMLNALLAEGVVGEESYTEIVNILKKQWEPVAIALTTAEIISQQQASA